MKKENRGILISTTYDLVCKKCKKVIDHRELGEYPWSWQFAVCNCGGAAIPDMDSGKEHWVEL